MRNYSFIEPAKNIKFPRVFILLALFPFLTLAAVIFTPAFPSLTKEFSLNSGESQWMMTLFLFGTAVGRLPYGPMANRWGRKITLQIGLVLAGLGTLCVIFSANYFFVCLGRFIQALGCAAALKIGQTMVGDLIKDSEATKIFSYGALAFAVVPAIGTAVGGLLTPYFGWRGGFWFFLLFTITLIFCSFFLHETARKIDPLALQVRSVLAAYFRVFQNLSLVLWGVLLGISTSAICIFAQEAPFIACNFMKISSQEYGLWTLIPALGVLLGSTLTNFLATKVDSIKGTLIGILVILTGSCVMWLSFLSSYIGIWALFLPQAIIQLGDSILFANVSSKCLSDAEDKSNSSAILLFITGLVAIFGTYFTGILMPKTLLGLPAVFTSLVIIMLLVWKKVERSFKILNIGN